MLDLKSVGQWLTLSMKRLELMRYVLFGNRSIDRKNQLNIALVKKLIKVFFSNVGLEALDRMSR